MQVAYDWLVVYMVEVKATFLIQLMESCAIALYI